MTTVQNKREFIRRILRANTLPTSCVHQNKKHFFVTLTNEMTMIIIYGTLTPQCWESQYTQQLIQPKNTLLSNLIHNIQNDVYDFRACCLHIFNITNWESQTISPHWLVLVQFDSASASCGMEKYFVCFFPFGYLVILIFLRIDGKNNERSISSPCIVECVYAHSHARTHSYTFIHMPPTDAIVHFI